MTSYTFDEFFAFTHTNSKEKLKTAELEFFASAGGLMELRYPMVC